MLILTDTTSLVIYINYNKPDSLTQGWDMKKENIIDLDTYREQPQPESHQPISEDLESAIKDLIYRLRELGPI